ncbi:hypothetical protein LLG07_00065 [bacterium]|nr:hypothetical protein [bacterium]
MTLIIYINKDDTWLEKIKEYAKLNNWSLSKAVRQILKAFVKVNMSDSNKTTTTIGLDQRGADNSITDLFAANLKKVTEKRLEDFNKAVEVFTEPEPEKTDIADFEANIMGKVNQEKSKDVEACIKEHTNDKGEISCYFFDNAREYHPYCKKDCWTQEHIWGKRVRP